MYISRRIEASMINKKMDQAPTRHIRTTTKNFAISKGNNDLVKEVLDQRRLTSTKEIKKSDYEGICKYIEAREGRVISPFFIPQLGL